MVTHSMDHPESGATGDRYVRTRPEWEVGGPGYEMMIRKSCTDGGGWGLSWV